MPEELAQVLHYGWWHLLPVVFPNLISGLIIAIGGIIIAIIGRVYFKKTVKEEE